jgi:predicted nucleic acid-binding protein
MEHAVVLDANVVVRAFLDEEYSDLAVAIITDSVADGRPIFAPFHFQSEVMNTIHKHRCQRNISSEEANQALARFLQLQVNLVSSPELNERAFAFAHEHGLATVYDSLYAVLAESLDAEFWTNDRRFIRQAGSSASWIRWLGDYQPEA